MKTSTNKTNLKSLPLWGGLMGLLFLFSACGEKKQTCEKCTIEHLDWSRNAVIYEVNVRQYTPEGTFEAFEAHLPRLKELGVDILWFMPIHPISETKRKGTLGSYYAVSDYKAVNPEFGTYDDFRRLVNKAHEMGFKVILDWVANHTGWDNAWFANNPEWYVTDENGEIVSPYDWTDTAELNYDNEAMRRAMIDALKFWVEEFDVDGYRCDVAHEVPTDFWNEARKQLDKVKPVFMLAEADYPPLLEHAFDMDYGWELMHIMNMVAKGEKNANDIYEYIQKLDTLICPDAYKMNFITNHDENSWNGTEFERYGEGASTFAVLTYALNGMPLIYTAQETGMDKRLEFFEKDEVPNWTINETFIFYQKLNQLKHSHPTLEAGEKGGELTRIHTTADEDILIFSRKKGNNELIVFLNLSDQPVSYTIVDKLHADIYTDFFTEENRIELPTELAAWEYRILIK